VIDGKSEKRTPDLVSNPPVGASTAIAGGFAGLGADGDVLAAALRASHTLPPDRVIDLLRQAGSAIGAIGVSMWLIDYGQSLLKPFLDRPEDVASSDGTMAVSGTTAGRAFARCEPIESDRPVPHRWVPILDGTERLGVLRFEFIAPLTEHQRRSSDALTSLAGELLVSKREHTDQYDAQRREFQMSLAAELQWRQLPPLESSIPAAAVAGFVQPAYGLGGDGFDHSINGDTMDLTIYDAVGHGLHSALLSTLMISSLRHSRRLRLALAERLAVADEAITSIFPGDFVTAQVAELSSASGTLTWVNAGHPLPMLIRNGVVVGELDCAPRPPVGLQHMSDSETVVATVQLQRSDRVLFYTDGLVEGGRRGRARFGVDRLGDLLTRAHTEGLACAETVRQLGRRVLEHADYELNDDATMLLVEWLGEPAAPPAGEDLQPMSSGLD
jgi:serine phosphatase RsbU (regulator of sigma subunit)